MSDKTLEVLDRQMKQQDQWFNGYQQAIEDVRNNVKTEMSMEEYHEHMRECINRDVYDD